MAGGGGEGANEYEVNINLTAMLDVLTNLLFFLMFGLAAQQSAIENEGGVQLASSNAELPPKKTTNVVVGQRELRVDKEVVATIQNGKLVKLGDEGRVEPLFRKLVAVKGKRIAGSKQAQEDEDVLMVLCDKGTPYTLLRRVLITSAEAGFPRFRMAVLMVVEAENCARCGRPPAVCVCDRTTAIASKRRVLVLQHPREKDAELGSAKLLAMSLAQGKLVVGLSWASLSSALGEDVDPSHWAVVFPQEARSRGKVAPGRASAVAAAEATKEHELDEEFELVDRQGEAMRPRRVNGIVMLDGSWSQAKSLWWRNPWLLKLSRMTLRPKEPSIYGSLRPEPRRDYVSTLEAAGAALTALGEPPEVEAELRRVFRTLVQRCRDARKSTAGHSRPTEAGRASRLKRRRKARVGRGGPARTP